MSRILVVFSIVLWSSACSDERAAKTVPAAAQAAAELEPFFGAGPLEPAVPVLEARPGDDVVVHGRVKDFVGGIAAFTLIDASLKACGEDGPDACKTPWDYCCHDPTELAAATLTVELHAGGKPIRADLEGRHGLDHLRPVAVRGALSADAHGNRTLVARAIAAR